MSICGPLELGSLGQPEYRREGRRVFSLPPPSPHQSVSKRSYNVPRFILLPPKTNIFHVSDVCQAVVLCVLDGAQQLPRMVLNASIIYIIYRCLPNLSTTNRLLYNPPL